MDFLGKMGASPSNSSRGLICQLPVSFSFEKIHHSLFFNYHQVLDMSILAERL